MLIGVLAAVLIVAIFGWRAGVSRRGTLSARKLSGTSAGSGEGSDGSSAGSIDGTAAGSTGGSADGNTAGTAGTGEGADGSTSGNSTASPAPPRDKKYASPMDRYHLDDHFFDGCPARDVQLLTPNEYSRPQTPLEVVNDIVVHYVDEPTSTAMQNRDYFESLKDGSGRSVSSHFVIGLEGEIVQCVPLGEVAYASNHRNGDTISIECCHPDDTGEFTSATYKSCVDLSAWLCYAFEITPDHVIRHYDVNEKYCPIYYVLNPEEWDRFKEKVAERYDQYVRELGPI